MGVQRPHKGQKKQAAFSESGDTGYTPKVLSGYEQFHRGAGGSSPFTPLPGTAVAQSGWGLDPPRQERGKGIKAGKNVSEMGSGTDQVLRHQRGWPRGSSGAGRETGKANPSC